MVSVSWQCVWLRVNVLEFGFWFLTSLPPSPP